MKSTKVILNQDVYNLGEEGDVREVAPGYARNFLIPQGLAVAFSKKNQAEFEQRRDAIEKRKEEKRFAAKNLKDQVESTVIQLEMPAGDTGKLFGSVNSANIAEKLTAEGINIERKKIDVPDNHIKMVGEYTVRVRLYGDEVAEMKVVVDPIGGKKPAPAPKVKEAKAEPKETEAEAPAEAAAEAEPEAEAAAEVKTEEVKAPAEAEASAEEAAPEASATEEPAAEESADEPVADESADEPAAEESKGEGEEA